MILRHAINRYVILNIKIANQIADIFVKIITFLGFPKFKDQGLYI